MIKLEYNGSRDIEIHNGTWNSKAFKVRASSESGRVDIPRTTRTWHFQAEDGTEYRIQIQETKPQKADQVKCPECGASVEIHRKWFVDHEWRGGMCAGSGTEVPK